MQPDVGRFAGRFSERRDSSQVAKRKVTVRASQRIAR